MARTIPASGEPMIKQCLPVVAIGVILSACASMGMPPAQTVAVEEVHYTTNAQTAATIAPAVAQATDPAVPQATITRVFWFFGDR